MQHIRAVRNDGCYRRLIKGHGIFSGSNDCFAYRSVRLKAGVDFHRFSDGTVSLAYRTLYYIPSELVYYVCRAQRLLYSYKEKA